MKTSTVSIVIAALTIAVRVSAQAPVAEFTGIHMIAQSYGDENESLRPFQAFDDGVKVAFLVKSPAGGIIRVDTKQGSIESFVDDKGTKLHAEGEFKNGFGTFPRVRKDGKAAGFTVEGLKPPAAGATKIMVKGKVALKTATTKETVKGGAVAKGRKLTFKALSMTVETLEKAGSDTKVEVVSPQTMDAIMEVRWLDAAGKKLEADDGVRGSMGFGEKITYSHEWTVKGTPATVEFTGWTDMKLVEVPFEATIAIGVAGGKVPGK